VRPALRQRAADRLHRRHAPRPAEGLGVLISRHLLSHRLPRRVLAGRVSHADPSADPEAVFRHGVPTHRAVVCPRPRL
jgi:hypothetical protein